MKTIAQAILFDEPGHAVLVEQPVGTPGRGELLLQAELTLVSAGTERLQLLKAPSYPVTPGHSMVGRVLAVGPEVHGFSIDDRVVAHVAHASHVVCDQRWALPIGEDLRAEEAVFFTIGGLALFAVRLARLKVGDPLLILGQGLIGLVATQVARFTGAAPLTVVDVVQDRLALAREFGADRAFHAEDTEALYSWLASLPGGGPAATIELSGASATIDTAVAVTRRQGRIVTASLVAGGHQVDIYGRAWLQGLSIVGAYYNARPWQLDATETTTPRERPVRFYDAGCYEDGDVMTGRGEMALFLRLLELGRMRLQPLVNEIVPADAAPAMFARLPHSTSLGHLIQWS